MKHSHIKKGANIFSSNVDEVKQPNFEAQNIILVIRAYTASHDFLISGLQRFQTFRREESLRLLTEQDVKYYASTNNLVFLASAHDPF